MVQGRGGDLRIGGDDPDPLRATPVPDLRCEHVVPSFELEEGEVLEIPDELRLPSGPTESLKHFGGLTWDPASL